MAATEVAAAGWVFTINAVPIEGIDSFTLSADEKQADTTTFDDAGFESHLVIRRGRSLKLSGKYMEDGASQATGQAAVEASALLVGSAAVAAYTITSPGGVAIAFSGTVKMDDMGGGNDDVAKWGCEITRTGADT
jgi:hypothetical protein